MSHSSKRRWSSIRRSRHQRDRALRRAARQLVAETLERRMLLAVVTSVDPAANSHAAPVSTNVAATFDENINAGTATADTFAVHRMRRGQLVGAAATVSAAGDTVTLDPAADFFPGETVKVTATSAIQGATPVTRRVWSFRAGVTSGGATFVDSGQTNLGSTYKNRLGDLDGDGDLDAYVLDVNGTNRIMMNDGSGAFTTSQTLGNFATYDVRLGDLDGDGDLDAYATGELYLNDRVWINDGAGQFEIGQVLADHAVLSVDLGDLDGDGDLDAYIGTRETNRVLINDGSGNFSDSGQDIGNTPSRKVKIGDVDMDGDLDLLSGNPDNPDRLFLNNGNAVFTDSGQLIGTYNSREIEFGDIDGDGDLDLLIVHRDIGNHVWLNDGGVFTDSGQRMGDHDTWGAAFGDLDGDGDLDIIEGNEGEANRVWLNDGAGVFTDTGQDLGTGATRSFGLGDLDGDGDLDAFTGNNSGSRIWFNQTLVPSVTLSADTATVDENLGTATITATLSAAHTADVTVELGISGTATDTDDYTISATQIVIPTGSTSGSVTVTAVQDTVDDDDETVIVDISTATNAQESGTQQVTITIVDDDDAVVVPDVTLSVDNANIPEAAGVAAFTATLSEVTTVPVTVDLSLAGSADASDYTASGTQIVIAAGATTGSITVTAVDDAVDEPDETVVVDIATVTGGNELGTQQQTTTITDDDLPKLTVTALTPTESGFAAEFSADLNTEVLNLYDTQSGGLGPADVVLQGATVGPVAGSLVVDAGLRQVTFIRSGGPLAPDTYTVTMRSAADGFADTGGQLLDGNDDGTEGDDYSSEFTVAAPAANAVTIGIPDFVRGPGQPVNLPADQTGIPVTISEGTNARAVDLRIAYDPALLTIEGATVGPDAPAGATVTANTSTPGQVILMFVSTTPLAAGSGTFISLQASVPAADASAIYGRQQVLDLHDVVVSDGNDNEVPSVVDDAFQLTSFFADVSGNGRVNAADAAGVARIAALIDNGFASSPNADPLIVGDISGNSRLNAADASLLAQFAALIDVPQIPPLPAGVVITGVNVANVRPGLLGILTPDERLPNPLPNPADEDSSSSAAFSTLSEIPRPAVDSAMAELEESATDATENQPQLSLEDAIDELFS